MDSLPQQEPSAATGLSLVNLKTLPDEQRQLINWMMRRGDCSLLEIAVHLCQDEGTALNVLSPLIEKGFLQQHTEENGHYYRVHMASRRGRQLPAKLKQGLNKKGNNKITQEEDKEEGVNG